MHIHVLGMFVAATCFRIYSIVILAWKQIYECVFQTTSCTYCFCLPSWCVQDAEVVQVIEEPGEPAPPPKTPPGCWERFKVSSRLVLLEWPPPFHVSEASLWSHLHGQTPPLSVHLQCVSWIMYVQYIVCVNSHNKALVLWSRHVISSLVYLGQLILRSCLPVIIPFLWTLVYYILFCSSQQT